MRKPRTKPKKYICEECGISFISPQSKRTGKSVFCSRKCSQLYSKIEVSKVCDYCKQDYVSSPTTKVKYCSRECQYKGKINPNLTDEDRLGRRNIREFHKWSLDIKIRDNFTCFICEERKDGQLESHHILPWAQYIELRYDLDNGVCLCKDCHKKFHHNYGRKNNTLEQLEEANMKKVTE